MDPLNLYKQMMTIRIVEDRLQKLCLEGKAGDLHFSKGQEAISVGVCSMLKATDHIVTHHRTIAHQIAKGADLYRLIAEVLGKKTGTNGGLAGEMHINDPSIHHDFSFQLVGTCVPVAVGVAYGLKYFQKTDDVVAVFFGDAATSNGQVHEGLNIASLKKVPLLLVCENNNLAGNIRQNYYLPTDTVVERMAAYKIPAIAIDGNDLNEVREATAYALKYIRDEECPFFIEMHTTRLCWHKQGQRDIRSQEELAELAKRDPIGKFNDTASVTLSQHHDMDIEIVRMVDEIIARVDNDPLPELTYAY